MCSCCLGGVWSEFAKVAIAGSIKAAAMSSMNFSDFIVVLLVVSYGVSVYLGGN